MFSLAVYRRILSFQHLRSMATEASQVPASAKTIDGTALAKFVFFFPLIIYFPNHFLKIHSRKRRRANQGEAGPFPPLPTPACHRPGW